VIARFSNPQQQQQQQQQTLQNAPPIDHDVASSSSDGADDPLWSAAAGAQDSSAPLRLPPRCGEKTVVVLRHGSSTWNEQVPWWFVVPVV